MKGVTGLCRYCKNYSWWCDENHYCDGCNGFAPFAPKDDVKYDRDTVVMKWMEHVKEMNK